MNINKPLQVQFTEYLSYDKGGYGRLFESTSHPGITGSVYCKNGHDEDRTFIFLGIKYKTVMSVLRAYRANPPKETDASDLMQEISE